MPNNIFLILNGITDSEMKGELGTDSSLNHQGKLYSKNIYNYFFSNYIIDNIIIFTSKETKSIETMQYFNDNIKFNYNYLNQLDYGNYKGMKNEDIVALQEKSEDDESLFLCDFDSSKKNIPPNGESQKDLPPNGESQKDLQNRVLSVMFELNNYENDDILICANEEVIKTIYTILTDDYDITIDRNSIIKINQDYINFTSKILQFK